MPVRTSGWGIGAIVLLLAGSGCGGDGPFKVKGVVTLDGAPVEGVLVIFEPEGGDGQPASASTDGAGRFQLTSAPGPGALRAEYRVTVSKITGPPLPEFFFGPGTTAAEVERANRSVQEAFRKQKSWLPAVYGNVAQTPLRCPVPAKGTVILDLKSSEGVRLPSGGFERPDFTRGR